ncbi:MAG: DUF1343 domain-containing protein, partial [Lachnospiraceae bacterium]|nr:DUF1343 domain-containing protein [Lachnospiraceae bacterium]
MGKIYMVFLAASLLVGCGGDANRQTQLQVAEAEAEHVATGKSAGSQDDLPDPLQMGDDQIKPESGLSVDPKTDTEMRADIEDTQAEATSEQKKEPESKTDEERVILGDEQFDVYLPLLAGKRVALFSNHTGIVGDQVADNGNGLADSQKVDAQKVDAQQEILPFGISADGEQIQYGEHILDALISRDVDVTVIFSPEHGFRQMADAGEAVGDSVDEKSGVPIVSLYNGGHSSLKEHMAQFDTLLIDMQDVGLRYYTYYLTMYDLMDACAAKGKEVILLDRPNPNGFYVDGPVLREEFSSGVGKLPLPIVHGMTWGELSRMINGEGWLSAGKDACSLTVIPCKNYTHQMKTSLICNPSPNIKDMRAVYLYASTCFFENTVVSVGRGTEFPFEAYASPYLETVDGYDFCFTPKSMSGAKNPPFEGKVCYGKDLRQKPLKQIWDEQIHLEYLMDAYRDIHAAYPDLAFFGTPDKQGRYWLDKLCGTDRVRLMIEEGRSAAEIRESWQSDIEAFKKRRRPYLLYEE